MMQRFALDSLAVRFSILLASALIVANIIAAGLLYADRSRQNIANRIDREVERIVSLVPAIEATSPDRRSEVARDASTRVSRLSVSPQAVVAEVPAAPRSVALARVVSEALGGRDVRASISSRQRGEDRRGGEIVALSILLRDAGGNNAQWLNSVSRGERRGRPPGFPEEILLLVLGTSLFAVLGVALLFVRHLTRPLKDLAAAARASGQGNRSIRVPETGPRELRAASAAFNEMQAQIARFDAERMRTMAAVGHDLRTPITSLRIRAEMLNKEEAAPMIRTLDEMTVMADGLVAYARGAGDAEEARRIELSVMMAQLCGEKGADYQVGTPTWVTGRPVALRRAIGNVVDNALRYAGAARVSVTQDGADAVVTIADDGPGIPAEQVAAMMQPFVRGDDSRNLKTGGAGLGLSIASNVLASHGGTLALKSRSEGGLCATIRLPLSDER